MEIKAELAKPYSEQQRIDFIVEYNHKLGYEITETETGLQALGYTYEELAQKEKERIAMLNLTGADVERAIYKAKGLDFDDILTLVEAQPVTEGETPAIDLKALRIELKANNFYRGNPYIDVVGTLLGFTPEQLNEFFETNDYTKLLTVEAEDENTTDTTDISDEMDTATDTAEKADADNAG